ncbi:MFS transporter, partial [Comamonas sp. B-9]|uniref:MFS transporter n=1 Tax=Comamonas sp. B-9 TaxID=1055192 RepID=UPI001EF9DB0C
MTTSTTIPPGAPGPSALGSLRQDSRTIGLVGLAHGSSHFFHLLLPPLFPWLIADFGFSYSELSVLVSAFFIVSGVGQALAGFVVDRFGARPIMFAALSSFAVAGVIAGTANSYAQLMLAAIFAGLGNAPFHPVDFTILNKRLSPQRLGHGFSVHGLSGNLGWAAAPVFMAGITSATGSWRMACLCGAALAAIILAIMVVNRDALDDRVSLPGAALAKAAVAGKQEHPMAFLKLPSVWLCFSFFFWTTCAMSAIQ